jgi:hypothetical protein
MDQYGDEFLRALGKLPEVQNIKKHVDSAALYVLFVIHQPKNLIEVR